MTDLQWRSITDFSPGIISNISPNHPDGAANPEGTFRCYAIQGGSLAPLPRLSRVIRPPIPGSGETIVGTPLPLASTLINEEHRIIGVWAGGPVFNPDEQTRGAAQDNTELFVAFDSWYDSPGINKLETISVYKYRRSWVDPEWELVRDDDYTIEPFNPFNVPPWGDFANTRSNFTDRNKAGPIITAFVGYGHAWFHPDDTNTGTNSTRDLPGNNGDPLLGGTLGAINMVAHQGRVVLFPLHIEGAGDDAAWVTNESLLWSEVNNARTAQVGNGPGGGSAGYFNVLIGWENPVGYHVMQSLSYDELLLIKSRGGALRIRGDLMAFTAEAFPYVRSTGYTNNRGTNTPRGFSYPVDGSGVWMWTGGQVSEFITPHLDDDFWRVPLIAAGASESAGEVVEMGFLHYPSQATQWGDFVMYPNNWLWDAARDPTNQDPKSAWWRIVDPSPVGEDEDEGDGFTIVRWTADWRQTRCYGTPTGVFDPDNVCVYEFDRQIPHAATFRWMSHPMSDTLEREVELGAIVVVASGKGAVRVRAFTAGNPTGEEQMFDVDGTPSAPTVLQLGYNVAGAQLAFDVRSTSDNPSNEAPTVHEIRYGTMPGHQIVGG